MGRLYPKNFVLLLLLLIFLEAIYESDSPGLVRGVGAVYMDDEHYASCENDYQCKQGFRCDPNRKKCVCRNQFDPKKKKLIERHAVFFDTKLGVCVAPIGKVCTFDSKDGLYHIGCVPYAFCAPQKGKELPDVFGLCQCNAGFEETQDHICEPEQVVYMPNPDGKPVPSMAHIVGAPVEGNMGTGSDNSPKDPHNEKGMPGITVDQENRNAHIARDSIDEVKKNWKGFELPAKGASQCVKFSRFLFLVTVLLTCFCYNFF